jgi:hypothetical protein
MVVEEIEWSEPLTLDQMKMLLYRMRLPEMEVHYKQWVKDQKALPPEQREKNPKTGKPKKILPWPQMAKALVGHFMKSAEIDKNVKMMYRYVAPDKSRTPDEE